MTTDDLNERVLKEISRLSGGPLNPGLYLVATPIGNLGDITLRALSVLARASLICCEDTRHSRTLLTHFAIAAPVRPYHEHNAAKERPRILAALDAGQAVALISDAGTPLVSDPGYKLVRAALEAGHRVESVPGPSAVLAALTSSGLPTDTFTFAGFLPVKPGPRRARIADLASIPGTLVLFETPSRLAATLADLAEGLGGERAAAVARELTKRHEEIMRDSLAALALKLAGEETKGECVVLVGPGEALTVADDVIVAHLRDALRDATLADAARSAAEVLRVPRSRVYKLALALAREREPRR